MKNYVYYIFSCLIVFTGASMLFSANGTIPGSTRLAWYYLRGKQKEIGSAIDSIRSKLDQLPPDSTKEAQELKKNLKIAEDYWKKLFFGESPGERFLKKLTPRYK